MMDFGSWGLKNRKLVFFLVAILLIGGLVAIRSMGKLEDPELTVKQALIVTTYPGASAHQVEMEVTDLLEKSIRTMKNLEYVESRSLNDLSMITVGLSTLVQNDAVDDMWTILRRKVSDVQSALPEGASASVVKDDFGDVMGMFYALTSDGFSDRELADYAELIKRNLQDIEGVSRVDLYGAGKECINIELYEDRLANLGISPAEVLSTLNGQNQTVYSGYYESGGQRLRVTVNDKYRNVKDIEDLLLQGHQGDQFRLGDIARVSIGYETPVRNAMTYDNQKAVGITISALTEADITKVGKKVEETVRHLTDYRLPAGLEMHKVFFQPDRVNDALNGFVVNLIESVLIVVILLIFFMGFRSGIIIGFNLVIIVLGSILILNFAGGTLQRVSLAAFILAMGMLVDNAIVILDGILIDLQRGVARRKALTNIGKKTAMPLLGATLNQLLDSNSGSGNDIYVGKTGDAGIGWYNTPLTLKVLPWSNVSGTVRITFKLEYSGFVFTEVHEIEIKSYMDYLYGTNNAARYYISALRYGTDDSPTRVNYSTAAGLCTAMGTGWRLPTISELGMSYAYNNAFSGNNGVIGWLWPHHWSSSTAINGNYLTVFFSQGYLGNYAATVSTEATARCVYPNQSPSGRVYPYIDTSYSSEGVLIVSRDGGSGVDAAALDPSGTANKVAPKLLVANANVSNGTTWTAATTACPSGWRLPTQREVYLIMSLGGTAMEITNPGYGVTWPSASKISLTQTVWTSTEARADNDAEGIQSNAWIFITKGNTNLPSFSPEAKTTNWGGVRCVKSIE